MYDCYDKLLETGNSSHIQSHNAVGSNASYLASVFANKIARHKQAPASIADVGCGIGEVAYFLKQLFPDAVVDGFELSHSAVAYGNSKFPNIHIYQKLIETDKAVSDASLYDAIVCHEFYPFTRCEDVDMHVGLFRSILASLAPDGIAFITGAVVGPSLDKSFAAVKNALQSEAKLEKKIFPMKKIVSKLGPGRPSELLTTLISPLAQRFLKKSPVFCVSLAHV